VIDWKIGGTDNVLEYLRTMPEVLVADVKQSIGVQILRLQRRVIGKLSGDVLQSRTGALIAAVKAGTWVKQTPGKIVGVVGNAGATKEVAIAFAAQEYGASIAARILSARQAAALRFTLNGQFVFAKQVMLPAIKIPEHSFLRTSFRELRGSMAEEINKAAQPAPRWL
jgi:hypothetical protein